MTVARIFDPWRHRPRNETERLITVMTCVDVFREGCAHTRGPGMKREPTECRGCVHGAMKAIRRAAIRERKAR